MRTTAAIWGLLVAAFLASGCRTTDSTGRPVVFKNHAAGTADANTDIVESSDPPADLNSTEPAGGDSGSSSRAGSKVSAAADKNAKSAAIPPTKPAAGDDQDIERTISELVAAGVLDRAAQQQLNEDLRRTEPALRGQVVQLLRASLASQKTGPSALNANDGQGVASDSPRVPSNPIVATVARKPAGAAARPPTAEPSDATVSEPVVNAPPAAEASLGSMADSNSEQVAKTAPETMRLPATAETESPKNDKPPATGAHANEPKSAAADALDWEEHLDAATEKLAGELQAAPQSGDDVGRHVMLRFLYLVGGERELALKAIPGIPPAQQDFWSKELFGLASYLDADRNANPARRASEAIVHLRDATARLGELANLSVRNLAFCSEVKSYGIYKKFDKYEFAAGQEVLLYAEVENFKSVHSEHGYHTALGSSYEILDHTGARVVEQGFPLTEEHCQNARRDFFVRYFVTIPPQIYGGKYTLHLYITDEHNHKMDNGSVEFTVKTKAP